MAEVGCKLVLIADQICLLDIVVLLSHSLFSYSLFDFLGFWMCTLGFAHSQSLATESVSQVELQTQPCSSPTVVAARSVAPRSMDVRFFHHVVELQCKSPKSFFCLYLENSEMLHALFSDQKLFNQQLQEAKLTHSLVALVPGHRECPQPLELPPSLP